MIFYKTNKQKYDAWLHWNISSQCNFDCNYCFGKTPFIKQTINSIDVKKLIKTLNQNNKIFRISFTGGEPFLIPNIVDACASITERHFISLNSNLILPGIEKFAKLILNERVLFIHASLHIEELIKTNLLNRFIGNFKLLRECGFNIFSEAVADPSLLETDIIFIRKYLDEHNISFSFGPFIGFKNGKRYPEEYTHNELALFRLQNEDFNKFKQKGSICNAGFNAAVVYPSGSVHSCFQLKEKLGNIYEMINFKNEPAICPAGRCDCPLNYYDPHLFNEVKDKIS
jgi:MoaA/NifB/PqqE/SkfB family radical SAM enzyme